MYKRQVVSFGTIYQETREKNIDQMVALVREQYPHYLVEEAYSSSTVRKMCIRDRVLRPLMVVAGDHANNDMAGEDDDSWKSMFEADGSFESVTCQIAGLGRSDTIEQLYVSHTQDAIDSLGSVDTAAATTAGDLEDGTYSAVFDTDSSMFHVNEAVSYTHLAGRTRK